MAISMDIGEGFIRIIKGEYGVNSIKINNFYELETDQSYIKNGYIINKADLTISLTKFIEENNLKNEDCFLSINTTDIVFKELILPKTNAKNLNKIILNQLDDIFGSDLSKIYIDYTIVEEFKKDNSEFYKIHIYSLPKKMVKDYESLLNNAGLKPKSLDVPKNFIKNILQKSNINEKNIKDEVSIFIGMYQTSMVISLITDTLNTYKRYVDISDELIREKMFKENQNEETHNEDQAILEAAVSIVEEKKDNDNEITFLDETDDFDTGDRRYISPIFLKVEEEIYKIIQFSMSLNNNRNISRVFMYGVSENMEGIAEYITNYIELPAEKITKISNLKSPIDVDISKFFICIANILRK